MMETIIAIKSVCKIAAFAVSLFCLVMYVISTYKEMKDDSKKKLY